MIRAGLWNILGRGSAAAGMLVVAAVASRALTPPEFAIWAVLSTLAALLAFGDLGVVNAATSELARAIARDDAKASTAVTTSALVVLCGAGVALVIVAGLVVGFTDVRPLFGVADRELPANPALFTYVSVFAIGLPLSIGPRLLVVLDRSRALGLLTIVVAAAQVGVAIAGSRAGIGLVGFSALAAASGPAVGALALGTALIAHRPARPRRHAISREAIRRLRRRSSAFLLIGVAAAIGFESDAALVAALVSAGDAATYAVSTRLFLLLPTFIGVACLPLWPAVARGVVTADRHLRRLFLRSVLISGGVAVVASAIGLALIDEAVAALFEGVSAPTTSVKLTIAAVAIVFSISAPVAAFLGGLDLVRAQALSAVTMAVVNVGLSVVLARRIGASGPPLATFAAQVTLTLVPMYILIRRAIDKLSAGEQAQ